ncbi:hypothetical protein GSI_04758 [Ganoderma sinense ZZ0214-1]|uniref:Tyr recombinase domain-containing protein n=1 Tax=Ganoderma sinense ZZ0214-1 TaxID=1077348 RepID=A0A2G8SIC1_9APHY|nr:hypothetical protein GSI_04758 [Ganoderma sinense ZZ0214-1]
MTTQREENGGLQASQRATISKCEQVVDDYRTRRLARASAVRALTTALSAAETSLDDAAIDATLDSYLAQLDDADRIREEAGRDLQQRFRGGAEGVQDGSGSKRIGRDGEEDHPRRDTQSTLRSRSTSEPREQSTHATSPTEEEGSRSPSCEPSSDGHRDKRQRPDSTKFPWAASEQSAASNLRPELLETLDHLKRFSTDIKYTKSHLINSAGAPEFPEAEWTNILSGHAVDLDRVLSNVYAHSSDDKHIQHLGDVELRYKSLTPVKTVQSAGDWVIAWQRTALATTYAFPHRRAELDAYHAHIFSLFSAVDKSLHQRVIHYDRAVRKRVGSVRNLLLSDIDQFSTLRTLWIDSCGANVVSNPDGSASGSRSMRLDPVVNATLTARPDLFQIVTPIKVDVFESLLVDHPNQPFVRSVCRGLREGFWPYADEKPDDYPDTWDEVRPPLTDERACQFLRDQRDEEIALGRYSPPFGPDLLPGMYSMPIHVVPKPHSDKLRLINNLSAGPYSLNSMIRPESIRGAVLDGMPLFGAEIRRLRREFPGEPLILWKSDVSQAYRRIPISPFWQIRQIVTIEGQRHVDRCNPFGGRGSLRLWLAFYSLVAWIAVIKRHIDRLLCYVDDSWGITLLRRALWYARHRMYRPEDQTRLLILWDDLGINHDDPKQLADILLTVIGFLIDAVNLTASLPPDSKSLLLDAVRAFIDPNPSRRRTLAEFRALAGHINWAFNVYPLLKPALSNLYAKIADKDFQDAPVYVNKAIRADLTWFASHVERLPGVHFLAATAWSPADLDVFSPSDELAFVDASPYGLGIYFPWLHMGFYAPPPPHTPTEAIFFLEALAVCSALHRLPPWILTGRPIHRFGVLSDNTNTVSIFHSLKAEPIYNPILISTVDIRISFDIDMRVDHIPGELNLVADALSRRDFQRARRHDPQLVIFPFIPPRDALGDCALTALRCYLSFCERQRLSVDPTPDTLSLFVAYEGQHIDPRSVDSYLSGICAELEPFYPDVRRNRLSRLVRDTLKGSRRLYSKPVRRKAPLTASDIATFHSSLPSPPSHDDLLFFALLLTGFHGLARLGDLVWPDRVRNRTYSTVSRRLSVQIADDHYSFLLQTHKSDAFFEGDRILVEKHHPGSDPMRAFTNYLASRDRLFPFRSELWLRASGSIPLRGWFLRRLSAVFPPSTNISGHSMRAGGATSLALAGASGDTIRSVGRWSSDAWQRYVRKHPSLLHAILSTHQNEASRSA